MTDRITLALDIAPVIARLDALLQQLGPGGLEAPLREMGEDLVDSIKRRFETSTGPDGKRWVPNSMATIMGYLEQASGNYRKDGRLSAKGAGRVMSKRPLVATGILQDTIRYEVAGDSLFVGTNRFAGDWDGGAAVLHFGSKDGSIPARPFLGADEDDVQRMLASAQSRCRQCRGSRASPRRSAWVISSTTRSRTAATGSGGSVGSRQATRWSAGSSRPHSPAVSTRDIRLPPCPCPGRRRCFAP